MDFQVKPLNREEKRVIEEKGTEAPFSGRYCKHSDKGVYHCRRCGAALYRSESKFDSGCGWPAFDGEIPGAVTRVPDPDGLRTEITCSACGGHLGHVFEGEGFTPKNTRHCVNSVSLEFRESGQTERAIFAGGCFWGLEYHLSRAPGVVATRAGYTGGRTENPSYEEVCRGGTGHFEAVETIFNPELTSYGQLLKFFFQVHDFTQVDGQGPDIGPQYLSAVFVNSEEQRRAAEDTKKALEKMGYRVATKILPAARFYPAEDYHQSWCAKTGQAPCSHFFRRIFKG